MSDAVISIETQRIMRLIPGYDPFATAPEGYWFDPEATEAAIAFFPEHLRHIEGALAGEPFVLELWQQAIIGNLFGWKRKDNKGRIVRRYQQCFIFVPRKNGKTPLAAGIGLYCLFCDPEKGQQNYIAASTREQAGLLFRHCRGMVQSDPELENNCTVYGGTAPGGQSQSIVRQSRGSFLKVISADVSVGKHGKNLNVAIVDELHEQSGRDTVDTLRTSMASANKPQPLLAYTTTSDFDRPGSICNEIEDYARKVRDGVLDDPKFLPVIYAAAPEDDWTSPEVWARVNPNLGISVSEEYLADECTRAKENPALENLFKRLHLNMRTQQATRWINLENWDATDAEVDMASLEGQPCWCGLDLSTTTDLSAFAMVFRRGAGGYDALVKFWVPEENALKRARRDRVPYDVWIKQGHITATPGASIDYDRIRADINAFGKLFNIREIAADRWNATQLITQLEGDGFTTFAHGQGYKDMTAPAKEFERAIAARELAANKNPVLRWMVDNVAAEMDAAGNIKPSKARSSERIDGVVALVMGIGRASLAQATPKKRSFYEDHVLEFSA